MVSLLRPLARVSLGLALAASTFAPQVARADDAASAIVKQVEAKYRTVTSIKATVVQTTKSELFGAETVKGELVLKRPAMMRWNFGDQKMFVTNGKKMWVYTAEDKQVIEYDDISSGRATADSLLTSMDKLTQTFDIKVVSTAATGHQLQLKPKSEAQFKEIDLTLNSELVPVLVVITDTFDNVTTMAFASVQLNAPADDSLFTFQPPAGVSVVKGTTN